MKLWIKLALYLLGLALCQSVLLPRLNLWGVVPDIFFVSTIVMVVLSPGLWPVFFAFLAGGVQDAFSVGNYFNALTKTLLAGGVAMIRQSYLGNEVILISTLVGFLAPLIWLVQVMVVWGDILSVWLAATIFLKIILVAIYNLSLIPPIIYITRLILDEG